MRRHLTVALSLTLATVASAESYTVESKRAELKSKNGKCEASVIYPQIRDQPEINAFLATRWKGANDSEMKKAVAGCSSNYLVSIGFDATTFPSGVVSLKRIRSVSRGVGMPATREVECHLIDVRRGGQINLAKSLGPKGLAQLSKIVADSVHASGYEMKKIKLTPSNFSVCLAEKSLLVQLSPKLMIDKDRSVEVQLSLDSVRSLLAETPLASAL